MKDGWLVPILIQRIYLDSIDLSIIGKIAGDFNQGELASTMERDKVIHGVAEALLSEAGDKRTLVFTSSVIHAHGLSDILNQSKPGMAAAIDGKTPKDKRKFILDEYRAGNIQYLCNVGIATEGFDVPNIDCVAIARPTMSRALYAQMVGRGTRPLAGVVDGFSFSEQRLESISSSLKPSCLILDFVGNSGKHKLVSAADVLGGNYDAKVVTEANKMATDDGSPIDTLELLKRAEASLKAGEEADRQRELRRAVSAKVSYRKKSLDPFDILDIEPPLEVNDFNARPISDKQRVWLETSGFDIEMMTDAERRKILNQMIYRKKNNLASPKQIKLLQRFGYNARSMKKSEASGLIDAIAKNNWKRV